MKQPTGSPVGCDCCKSKPPAAPVAPRSFRYAQSRLGRLVLREARALPRQ